MWLSCHLAWESWAHVTRELRSCDYHVTLLESLTIANSLSSRLGHEGSHYSVHAVFVEVVQEERLLHSLLNRQESEEDEIYFQARVEWALHACAWTQPPSQAPPPQLVTKAEEEPWNKDTCHGTINEAYLAVKSQPQICYTRTQSIIVQDTAQPILGLIYCAQACTIAVHLRLLFLSWYSQDQWVLSQAPPVAHQSLRRKEAHI